MNWKQRQQELYNRRSAVQWDGYKPNFMASDIYDDLADMNGARNPLLYDTFTKEQKSSLEKLLSQKVLKDAGLDDLYFIHLTGIVKVQFSNGNAYRILHDGKVVKTN